MWAAFRVLRLTLRSLARIATALEELNDSYKLELSARGITRPDPTLQDPVEVQYSQIHIQDEL